MERTIRVTGKGKLSLSPDYIRVNMSLEDLDKDYEKSIRNSSERADAIITMLEGLGFDKKDIKTTNFNVDTHYDNYDTKTGWRRVFKGYKVNRTMAIEFGRDNKLLGNVVYELAKSEAKPEFSLRFFVKDQEAMTDLLLTKAVEDAQSKAKILATASGVSLGNIVDVNYSWGELRFESRNYDMPGMMYDKMCCYDESMELNIEPEDIDIDDTVTMVFEIN